MNLERFKTEQFTSTDYTIMHFLVHNEERVLLMTSEEIANELSISNSSMTRFWKKNDFLTIKGYRKQMLADNLRTPDSKIKTTLSQSTTKEDIYSEIFHDNIQSIMTTKQAINPQILSTAVDMIIEARHIYIYAPDVSSGCAQILSFRLRRYGYHLIVMDQGTTIYESLNNVTKQDLIIVFCLSHVLNEIRILLEEKATTDYKLLLITDLLPLEIPPTYDEILTCYRGQRNEYHSVASLITLLDCIILMLAQKSKRSLNHISNLKKLRNRHSSLLKR